MVTTLDLVVEVDFTGLYAKKLGINEPMLYAIYRMLQSEKRGYPLQRLVRDIGITTVSHIGNDEESYRWNEFRSALKILAKAGVIELVGTKLVRIKKHVGWDPVSKKRRGLATYLFSSRYPIRDVATWDPEELYTETWKQLFFHHVS